MCVCGNRNLNACCQLNYILYYSICSLCLSLSYNATLLATGVITVTIYNTRLPKRRICFIRSETLVINVSNRRLTWADLWAVVVLVSVVVLSLDRMHVVTVASDRLVPQLAGTPQRLPPVVQLLHQFYH